MKETEVRADSWLELTEKAFDFACHARAAFENGDMQTKKGILSAIGLNCTLKDHKIALQTPFWLVPIKERYPALEAEFKAFELDKKPYTKRQKEAFASLSPEVRALRDDVGTGIIESENFWVPDLVFAQ